MMIFPQNSSILLSCAPTHHLIFHKFEFSRGASNPSLNKCGFINIGDDIFFICMHACDRLNKKLGLQI